jgi:hypothetical protein
MSKPVVGFGCPEVAREGAHVSQREGFTVKDLRKVLRKLPPTAIVRHADGEDYGQPIMQAYLEDGKVVLR